MFDDLALDVATDDVDPLACSSDLLRPDGTRWPLVWHWASGDLIGANSRTGIVASMLPDYPDQEPDAFITRVEVMARLAQARQGFLVDNAVHDGLLSLGGLGEAELTMLFADKRFPHPWPAGTPWPDMLPTLCLLALHYQPQTSTPPPSGNVLLLDPSSETTFLEGLVEAGVGELWADPQA